MLMSWIWTGMVGISILCALWSGQGVQLAGAVFQGAQSGVSLVFSMVGAVCLWLWDWCYRCAAVSFRSGDFDIGGRQLPEAYGERNVRAMKVQVLPGPTMELHSSSRSVPPLQQRWGPVILQVWQPLLYPVVREPCSGCGSPH